MRRSAEEKRQIVEETMQPEASVARVARARGVNANQVFHWRRQYRRGLLEETLTVHRFGVGWLLRRTLASTNPIESCLSTVERVARNVKRWREGEQALRWTATGLLEAQKKFRRVKGFRELESLHRRVNPSLTRQAQVA